MNIKTDKWVIEQKVILKGLPPITAAMPGESKMADHPTLETEVVWFAHYLAGYGWPSEQDVLDAVDAVRRESPSGRIFIGGFPKFGDRVYGAEVV